jgi:LmeA-like phospholipid-binding
VSTGQPGPPDGDRSPADEGRPGRRRLRTVLLGSPVVLGLSVVLGTALLLWGADRLARWGAESLLARNVQSSTGAPGRPSVDVHGTFFLPQVVRGRYDDVEITVRDLSSGPLRLAEVHARLSGVHLSFHDVLVQDLDPIGIDRSVEEASLTYADLNRYLQLTGRPLSVAPADGDGLRLTGTVDVLGRSISASTQVRLSVRTGALAVAPTQLATDTPLDAATGLLLGQRFTFLVPLDPLPFGQVLTAVEVGEGGLVVRAGGNDVVIRP